jgi:signal transduction histidine kinase
MLLLLKAVRRQSWARFTTRSCAGNMIIVRDSAGEIDGTAAIIRDVTARWQKEKALRVRLAELEKQICAAS